MGKLRRIPSVTISNEPPHENRQLVRVSILNILGQRINLVLNNHHILSKNPWTEDRQWKLTKGLLLAKISLQLHMISSIQKTTEIDWANLNDCLRMRLIVKLFISKPTCIY